jgi:hypothetical protein
MFYAFIDACMLAWVNRSADFGHVRRHFNFDGFDQWQYWDLRIVRAMCNFDSISLQVRNRRRRRVGRSGRGHSRIGAGGKKEDGIVGRDVHERRRHGSGHGVSVSQEGKGDWGAEPARAIPVGLYTSPPSLDSRLLFRPRLSPLPVPPQVATIRQISINVYISLYESHPSTHPQSSVDSSSEAAKTGFGWFCVQAVA